MSEVFPKPRRSEEGKKRPKQLMAENLRQKILGGILQADDFLPPERQLAAQYGVSSRVVRECLAGLEAEGLVLRQQGRGTQVLPLRDTMVRQTKNLALVILQRMRDTSTIEFFDSLQQVFQRAGYGTTIFVSDNSPEKEAAIVKSLVADRVPGVVLFTAHEADSFAHLQAAQEAGVKVALYDHFCPDLSTNFAGVEDQLGTYEATTHLLQMGCEELVFINSALNWTTHTLRQKGFEEAVEKWGVPVKASVLKLPLFEKMKKQIFQNLPRYFPSTGRKLGVVSWSDQGALQAIACVQAHGLSVPEDVAVIGFSDDMDAAIAPVPLTTMRIPRADIARFCAYSLLDRMRDPELPPQHITFRPHLIIRASCGCYRRGK